MDDILLLLLLVVIISLVVTLRLLVVLLVEIRVYLMPSLLSLGIRIVLLLPLLLVMMLVVSLLLLAGTAAAVVAVAAAVAAACDGGGCRANLGILPSFFGSPIPYLNGGLFLVGQPIASIVTILSIFATSHRVSFTTASSGPSLRSPSVRAILTYKSR